MLSKAVPTHFLTDSIAESRHCRLSHGGVAKWLRQRSAKPLFGGSSPPAASTQFESGPSREERRYAHQSNGGRFTHCFEAGHSTRKDAAGVAELADARDLKSCGLRPMRVQFPPPAPTYLSRLPPPQQPHRLHIPRKIRQYLPEARVHWET